MKLFCKFTLQYDVVAEFIEVYQLRSNGYTVIRVFKINVSLVKMNKLRRHSENDQNKTTESDF
jgi:hypothetical protein